MRVLVLHGPNTRLAREPGGKSGVELDRELEAKARALGVEVRFAQSSSEGALVDRLEQERGWADAVVIEPGPLAHAGWSLREALVLLGKPAIEIVSRAPEGEPSRAESIFKDVCEAQLEGAEGYFRGLEQLARRGVAKTIGSRGAVRAEPAAGSRKSIGRAASDEVSPQSGEASDADGARRTGARSGRAAAGDASTSSDDRQGVSGRSGDGAGGSGRGHDGGHRAKTIGRRDHDEAPVRPEKSIGRRHPDTARTHPERSIGRGETHADPEASSVLGRALLQQKIRERLSGTLGAPELAGWAKERWLELQRGAVNPPERDRIEDVLQKLALSHVPPSRLSDEQLLDLLTELDR